MLFPLASGYRLKTSDAAGPGGAAGGRGRAWCLLGVLAGLGLAEAAPLERLTTLSSEERDLITDGRTVWVARYAAGAGGRLRRVANESGVIEEAAESLPADCVGVRAAPDGVLYAVALGMESGTGVTPSVHLWHRMANGAWTHTTLLREASVEEPPTEVRMAFTGARVIVTLRCESFDAFLGYRTDIPYVVDRESGDLIARADGLLYVISDGARFYGTRPGAPMDVWPRPGPVSVDGVNWSASDLSSEVLNAPWSFDVAPTQADNGRLFALSGRMLWVGHVDSGWMAYKIRAIQPEWVYGSPAILATFPTIGFECTRGGETCAVVCEEIPVVLTPNTPAARNGVIVISHDYLQTFEVIEVNDFGHLGVVPTGEALYLLRAEETENVLHRLPLPSDRPPLAEERWQLQMLTSWGYFYEPEIWNGDGLPTFELSLPDVPGAFYQLYRSTDLQQWAPLGLPAPAGSRQVVLQDSSVPRVFFK